MRRMTLGLVAVLCSSFSVLAGQQPREVSLGTPTAAFKGEFSLIRGVREQADGSVLVADPIDAVLRRLDKGFTRADTIGRIGAGPDEYKQPEGIWPLPADSSLLVDLGNNRIAPMDARGRFGKTEPIVGGSPSGPEGISVMLVGGVDAQGRMYYRAGRPGDSIPLVRRTRGGQTVTLAMLKAAESKTTESGGPNNRSQQTVPVPMSPQDGWAVARDGTIFLVRSSDYHVEVLRPNGQRMRGAPVAYTPVRIDAAEKKAWADRNRREGGIGIQVQNRNGQVSMGIGRIRPQGEDATPPDLPWPSVKPAFDPNGIVADSKGRVWVRREQRHDQPAVYDVFDGTGNRVGTVRFPAGRRLLSAGEGTLYVTRTDEDDLQYLERYALPF